MPIDEMLLGFGMLSMIAASVVAIFQDDVKRLLAYSSVSQIGYMVLGLSLGTAEGLSGSIVHIFNHAMMKALLFMAIGCVVYRVGSVRFDEIAGFGRRMPVTAAAMLVGGLSLIGAPLTVGFVTKWILLEAAFAKGWWPVMAVIVASGLLALIYVWRLVELAYFRAPAPAVAGVARGAARHAGAAPGAGRDQPRLRHRRHDDQRPGAGRGAGADGTGAVIARRRRRSPPRSSSR